MNFNFSIPETIKKKVCRYLLHRYLGQFLEHNLQLEQLNVDLTSGKGTIVDIVLSTEVNICPYLHRLALIKQVDISTFQSL